MSRERRHLGRGEITATAKAWLAMNSDMVKPMPAGPSAPATCAQEYCPICGQFPLSRR